MIVIDMEQGSEEWFYEKAGKPGASSFDQIVTTKGEPSKQRQDYLYQLAGEAIIGRQEPGYTSAAMQAGIEREAESRAYFELFTGLEVRQVGLVYKDERRSILCSPDGLMDDCGLELKNPLLKTHVKYLINGTLPTKYFAQVQGSLYITGFESWFFCSYFPGLSPLILEVKRDNGFIEKLDREMEKFLAELVSITDKLRNR